MAYTVGVTRHSGKLVFMVVLHGDSLERMTTHDPVVVEGNLLAMSVKAAVPLKLQDVDFVVAYEPDPLLFAAFAQEHVSNPHEILEHISRGWSVKPEDTAEIIVVASTMKKGPVQ